MIIEDLPPSLLPPPNHVYAELTDAQLAELESYCKVYSVFMPACKRS